MDGILNIDKPAGWTSHDVVAKLRGILGVKRVGHGGTLDPMATGVLPVFVGRATRAVGHCENADKEYIATLKLGLVTDTQDTTGTTLSESEATVSAEELSEALNKFKGPQKQVPPMYSAIKIEGRKLYELARKGIEVSRPARDINIHAIELLEGEGADYIIRVACSKGTYIRTLCHDIGAALGCGAAMSALRRTRAGSFTAQTAITLETLIAAAASKLELAALLTPIDVMFAGYPQIKLDEEETRKYRHGVKLVLTNAPPPPSPGDPMPTAPPPPPRYVGADVPGRPLVELGSTGGCPPYPPTAPPPPVPDGTYRFYSDDGIFLMLGEVRDGAVSSITKFN